MRLAVLHVLGEAAARDPGGVDRAEHDYLEAIVLAGERRCAPCSRAPTWGSAVARPRR